MAIQMRRGNDANFDPNKLLAGEFAYVLDKGELYYCYSPGNVKKLMTYNDMQSILDASPEAYAALKQLIEDLESDPSEITNILCNIASLQSGKINTADIVNIHTNSTNKVPSAALVSGLLEQINEQYEELTMLRTKMILSGIAYPSTTYANQIFFKKL